MLKEIQILTLSSISLYWAQYKRKTNKQKKQNKKNKQKETVHILKVRTKVETLYLKTEYLQDTLFCAPYVIKKVYFTFIIISLG